MTPGRYRKNTDSHTKSDQLSIPQQDDRKTRKDNKNYTTKQGPNTKNQTLLYLLQQWPLCNDPQLFNSFAITVTPQRVYGSIHNKCLL